MDGEINYKYNLIKDVWRFLSVAKHNATNKERRVFLSEHCDYLTMKSVFRQRC